MIHILKILRFDDEILNNFVKAKCSYFLFSFRYRQIKHSTEKANFSNTVPLLLEHFKNMYFEFKLEKSIISTIKNIEYIVPVYI